MKRLIPRVLSVLVGLWLMAAPDILTYDTPASANDRIVGPIVVSMAIVAMAEVTRGVRRVNTLVGAWLLVAPWLLGYGDATTIINDMAAGGLLLVASNLGGEIDGKFGGGWRMLLHRATGEDGESMDSETTVIVADAGSQDRHASAAHEMSNVIGRRTLAAAQRGPSVQEGVITVAESMKPEVVVVTGASAGVGRATARAFGKRGAFVGLLARGADGLEAAKREIEAAGGRAVLVPTDVSDPEQVEAAAQAVEKAFGPIDIWVNNAMVSVFSPVKEMQPEDYRRVTEVNYLGYVNGTLAALRRMLPRDRGTIVQVGSALAYRGIPLQSAYCASKHAIEGFHDSLRAELIHDGSHVHVTMVQMPALNTPQFDWVKSRLPNRAQPVPPIFQPEVAAEAIVFAAHHRRRELTVGWQNWLIVWLNKFFPLFGDWYLARTGYKSQQTDEPRDPDRPNNLYDPLPGDHGAHGRFDARAQASSTQLWFQKHRDWVVAAAGGLLVSLFGAWLLKD